MEGGDDSWVCLTGRIEGAKMKEEKGKGKLEASFLLAF